MPAPLIISALSRWPAGAKLVTTPRLYRLCDLSRAWTSRRRRTNDVQVVDERNADPLTAPVFSFTAVPQVHQRRSTWSASVHMVNAESGPRSRARARPAPCRYR